jgi:acetyltransferase-like isoleucine patch superfamily enzyme
MAMLANFSNLIRGLIKGKQFCFIYPDVFIGKNVTIFPGAIIGRPPKSSGATKRITNVIELDYTRIGDNCVIGSNCVIYKGVRIGNNSMICDTACIRERVTIGENSLIAMGVTINVNAVIGDRTKIMDNCHITGNAFIGNNVFIGMLTTSANDNDMGKGNKNLDIEKGPVIKDGVRIGQGSCLFPEITIGENAIIGANSTVTKNVLAKTKVMGSPARIKS